MLLRIITSIDSDIDLYRSLIIPLIVYNNVLNVNRSVLMPLIVYSYLMGVDAIDQSICPEVLGMTKCSIA
jgi:hypothetical protein